MQETITIEKDQLISEEFYYEGAGITKDEAIRIATENWQETDYQSLDELLDDLYDEGEVKLEYGYLTVCSYIKGGFR